MPANKSKNELLVDGNRQKVGKRKISSIWFLDSVKMLRFSIYMDYSLLKFNVNTRKWLKP